MRAADGTDGQLPDWEAFYRDYRKPGYVDGFEITTKLGGGMFGLVFRARRMSIGKDYAIKFLQVDDTEVRRAVLSELEQVKFFAQIDHPNLVSIEDRGEVDGIPYLVMAFAGTDTLRDKMVAGRAPTAVEKDDLLRWFLQACRGLAALHERSLVHFDIKPANVFLKGAVARLGDYGLSKLVTHSRGSLSMGRGTPYYMAPEMLQRRGDHRSDIYSLGVMLYELLCGQVPFTGDSEWEVLKKHETTPPDCPAFLTTREREVLQRCLQKDPAARFQSVHDLLMAFGAVASPASASPRTVADPDLPASCLPPSLPHLTPPASTPPNRDATPPRSSAVPSATRSGNRAGMFVLLLLAVVAWLFLRANDAQPSLAYAMAMESAPIRVRASSSPPGIDQFVAGVLRSARSSEQRAKRCKLRKFDVAQFDVPNDYRLCEDLVRSLARAPAFVHGQAQKVEQLGRPALLAGVALLQRLDYDDARDCREASNVHHLLAQMTAIDALIIDDVEDQVTENQICRFTTFADGWRRFAEQFARDDTTFRAMLVARGKVADAGVDR